MLAFENIKNCKKTYNWRPLVAVILSLNKGQDKSTIDVASGIHQHLVEHLFLLLKLPFVVCMAWLENTSQWATWASCIIAQSSKNCGLALLRSRGNQARRAPVTNLQKIDLLRSNLEGFHELVHSSFDAVGNFIGTSKDFQRCKPIHWSDVKQTLGLFLGFMLSLNFVLQFRMVNCWVSVLASNLPILKWLEVMPCLAIQWAPSRKQRPSKQYFLQGLYLYINI